MLKPEEAQVLELHRLRLIDKYEGTIRGQQTMIKASMRIAYQKGLSDTLKTIEEAGFSLTKKDVPHGT